MKYHTILTPSEIKHINNGIGDMPIPKYQKEELQDHMTCSVTEKRQQGIDFLPAYDQAVHELNLVREDSRSRTVTLIPSKHDQALTRLRKYSGITSLAGILMSIAMKFMHLAHTITVLEASSALLIILYLPSLLLSLNKRKLASKKSLQVISPVIFIAIMFALGSYMNSIFFFPEIRLWLHFGLLSLISLIMPRIYYKTIELDQADTVIS